MAEFLIQALNETAPQRYWRGDIIQVYPDGTVKEPPAAGKCLLLVPGLDLAAAQSQQVEWWRRIDYTVVSSNLPSDSHRLQISATEINANSGLGKISSGRIENYLDNWGATGITFAVNSVTFDLTILDAIKSQGFWRGYDLTGLTLVEVSYTQGSGNHRCRVNYSNSSLTADQLKSAIAENGGTVVSENAGNRTITFDITRQTVRNQFQQDVKHRTEEMIVRRKFRFTEAAVAAMEEAGGLLTVSEGQYNTYFRNKLND